MPPVRHGDQIKSQSAMDAINIFVQLKKMASNVVRRVINSWSIVGNIEIRIVNIILRHNIVLL
jgi:hypothetical protein